MTDSDCGFTCRIRLNPEHIIYKAHFPEKPITPGVCILQIVQVLMELKTGRKMYLSKAANIKYLAVLSPTDNPEVSYGITVPASGGNECKIQVIVSNEQQTFAKLSLTFVYERI